MSKSKIIKELPSGHTLVRDKGKIVESTISKECKPGEILRQGFQRQPFVRSDGTHVRGSNVPATCIRTKGKRHVKTLPKPKSGELRRFGYKMNLPNNERHKALDKAANELSLLSTLRHVSLIRNLYSYEKPDGKHYRVLTNDLHYLEDLYDKYRQKNGPSSFSTQKGGFFGGIGIDNDISTDMSPVGVQIVPVTTQSGSITPIIIANDHVKVNDVSIKIKTLDDTNVPMIVDFKSKNNINVSPNDIMNKMTQEDFVGLFVDGVLKSLIELHLLTSAKTLQIINIDCSNEDGNYIYGKLLYKYLQRELNKLGVTKAFIDLNLTVPENLLKMDCYIKCGFKATDFNPNNNTIRLMCDRESFSKNK
jgi:hypothetical protein